MDGSTAKDTPEVLLERLDASIQEALDRLIDRGRIGEEHRAKADEFRTRLSGLQRRIAEQSAPHPEMPPDTRSDFDLLAWDFKRWLAEVDEDFDDKKAGPISSNPRDTR